MKDQATTVSETKSQLESKIIKEEPESLVPFYTIASLVQLSTLYRKVAETMIDDVIKTESMLKDTVQKKSSK
ncbi:hypothetical protein GCM10012290_04540 [Halolactibacillus alkaliphilus]|uniref:Uncharacterized protein n=1 Tax=Halolactibacillus alkaliphilus TaxID=442899 RepID=A0A511WZ98_9BACI|nr:hypothetical protein [Halolactibacillus alkaliphilus]GEN55912.1 hypothetical protein HAL01_03760 [Halolactibacillus alkaliphilus]GGN65630.1 hypothetical protein GCM10012290_04540 [Halolactibacillus alkaliphilus]